MTVGNRLKILRHNLNLTAKNLADLLDIPIRTIGGYERNENPPGEKFLIKLIEKFNVNVNWILTGHGSIFVQQSDNIIEILQNSYNISEDEARKIVKIIENKTVRELVLKFSKAKQGDIKSIDTLIDNLTGLKIAFL